MFNTIGQKYTSKTEKINMSNPWYVYKKNTHKNHIYICQGNVNLHLFKKELLIEKLHWINAQILNKGICRSKIRSQGQLHNCYIVFAGKKAFIKFKKKQKSVAIGQSIVFYKDKVCLGGGIIIK